MPLTYGSELLQKTATQSFWNGFYGFPDPFANLVFRRPSTQEKDTYVRLGAAPMPKVWEGEKDAKVANEYSYAVQNEAFEASVKVDKKLIKFQQWDEISNVLANLGAKARAHQSQLLSAATNVGDATVCEDKQFYFDTDHADPGAEFTTSQVNSLTANATDGTAPTDLE